MKKCSTFMHIRSSSIEVWHLLTFGNLIASELPDYALSRLPGWCLMEDLLIKAATLVAVGLATLSSFPGRAQQDSAPQQQRTGHGGSGGEAPARHSTHRQPPRSPVARGRPGSPTGCADRDSSKPGTAGSVCQSGGRAVETGGRRTCRQARFQVGKAGRQCRGEDG